MDKYNIVRFYKDCERTSRIIKKNLSLDEAQQHCKSELTHGVNFFDGFTIASCECDNEKIIKDETLKRYTRTVREQQGSIEESLLNIERQISDIVNIVSKQAEYYNGSRLRKLQKEQRENQKKWSISDKQRYWKKFLSG